MTTALRAEDLSRTFGERAALRGVTLTVERGQLCVVSGHNGSGKSTLLRIAAGLLRPTSGDIEVCGLQPGTTAARRAVSYIGDTPILYDDLSVSEHMEFVARLHGLAGRRVVAEDLVARLGLGDYLDSLPGSLSRGWRQRAALCLGFLRPFELVLIDEPFVGLDTDGQQALVHLLSATRERGATAIVATHQDLLGAVPTRTVRLQDGVLTE